MDIISKDNIKIIKTKKFKTITFKLLLLSEFTKENSTYYSLLSKVLMNSTKKYNTKKKIIDKLYDLYDANLGTSTSNVYNTNMFTFSLRVIDGVYVNDNSLIDDALDFLYEFIANPNVINNGFDEHSFNEEKKQLFDEISKIYNNKNRYAVKEAIKTMCPNEIISVSSVGTSEELEKITPESLYSFYKELISNCKFYIYAIGDLDNNIFDKFNRFSFIGKDYDGVNYEIAQREYIKVDKIKERKEIQNINQSKLVMGFRTNTTHIDEKYNALQVFNVMFGGIFTSDLFLNVREKNGLAYDISSQIVDDSKVLLVYAGIDSENYKKTVDIILDILKNYKKGNIDEELLETAKINIISEYEEIEDYAGESLMLLIKQDVISKNLTITETINAIASITKEDIIDVANEIDIDTIYLLSNK